MLDFLKNYYVFMLVLMVFSYLVPKEEYKSYIQFFISIFIIVLLIKPLIGLFSTSNMKNFYDMFEQFRLQIEGLEFEMQEGEDIYEHFFFEGEGE